MPLPTYIDSVLHTATATGITSFSPFAVGHNITNQNVIPEPASLTLLALGGLAVLSQKRRRAIGGA